MLHIVNMITITVMIWCSILFLVANLKKGGDFIVLGPNLDETFAFALLLWLEQSKEPIFPGSL